MTRPSRTPRRPSIGFCSCSLRTAASSFWSFSVASSPASAILTDRSVRSGRNSCSGGSISRIVTGRPSMASRISTKSPRCSGSRASSACWRPSSVSARIRSSTSWRRSPRNMCSVRTRPTPPAPNRRARAQSGPVSALACTPRRRLASACAMIGCTALIRSSASSECGLQLALEVAHDLGRRRPGPRPGRPRREVPSMEITSPSETVMPPGAVNFFAVVSTSSSSAPQTQVLPMPRATTAAWLVLPPRLVRMPWAAIMPCKSSGLVSRRTRMTFSPLAGQLDGAGRVEDGLADGRAGRRAHALGDLGDLAAGVEPGEHQPGQLVAGDPGQRLVHVDQALVHQLHRDPEGGRGGALAHPGLQHPELAALDGELDVAQVPVVVLQRRHDLHQLVEGGLVDGLQVLQRDGVPDAGDHVLALGVLQVVTVDAHGAGARVPGERDAGARVHAQVAEHHRDHVHGRAQVGGDALLAAVEDGAGRVPGVEHGLDGQVQLLPGVLREVPSGLRLDDALERLDQVLQVGRVQVEVVADALGLLGGFDGVLEVLAVDVEDGLAEHLDQAAVGVPGEPLVAGLLGQALHRLIRQADVQDGVHHARHGELRPGPDADQQRVGRIAELAVNRRFQLIQVGRDFLIEAFRRRALFR